MMRLFFMIILSSLMTGFSQSLNLSEVSGIDVSHHNGVINWSEVASDTLDIKFVYVKATEGATVRDNQYLANVKGARKAGFMVGAYHYFKMTSSAHDQFKNFSGRLDSAPFDLIPMVDVETRDKAEMGSFRDSLRVFLNLIEDRYHVVPMIYGTNRSYNELCGEDFDMKYPLYIGRYGDAEPIVKGRSRYTIWQFTQKGKVSGISKPVDLCRFNPNSSIADIMMPVENVSVETRGDLLVYTPHFSRIDLVTGTMPSKKEKDVIFVCEAAFTGQLLGEFRHSNIAGHHVSSGQFYKGYNCGPNNGVFTWSSGSGWRFYNYRHANSEAPLKTVAAQGGMGFCQNMLFHNGKRFKGCMNPESKNRYRALCELDGKLCIIDCAKSITFGAFMDGLQELGVKNAMYCDMGTGWNYSWYRKGDGSVEELFKIPGQYTTNWITFYK